MFFSCFAQLTLTYNIVRHPYRANFAVLSRKSAPFAQKFFQNIKTFTYFSPFYENTTIWNEKYFDILSDVYLMRVEQAEEQGTISEAEAQEAYDAAAGLTD